MKATTFSQKPASRLRILLASVCIVVALAPLLPSGSVSAGRLKRWRKDLKFLRNNLTSLHVSPFSKVSQAEFNRAADELNEAIPSISDSEVVVGMTRLVAMIGDGHTRLDWERTASDFRTYPLRLYWFTDGLHVIQTTASFQRALKARVVAIGNTDIDTAFEAVSPLIAHENKVWLRERSPDYLVVPEILNAIGILPDMEKGTFVFEDAEGARFMLDFPPLPRTQNIEWIQGPDPTVTETPLYRKRAGEFYWFEEIPQSQAFYFKYNVCQSMSFPTPEQFSLLMTNTVNSHPVDRFIIDVRDNGGGSSQIFARLMSGFKNRFDQNRKGHLFVIIGRATFSSGMWAALNMRDETAAILMGEPTGGRPNAPGDVQSFTLARSGLVVNYSTKIFKLTEGDPPSVAPDITVQLSSDDFFSGRDPVLAAALAYEKQ